MTLVVGVVKPDGGVWMGGDRYAGSFDHTELANPKVFQLATEDGVPFLAGFAGSPRVAQVILAVHPGPRAGRSLHWWLTDYCSRMRDAAADQSVLCDPHNGDGAQLAGHTGVIVGIDGHVMLVDEDLAWEEKTRGWEAAGGAFESFGGAFSVLRELQPEHPVRAARKAWRFARQFHRIGSLADQLTIPPRPGAD